MSDEEEEINIKIHESRGFIRLEQEPLLWVDPSIKKFHGNRLTDYCNDLNAIREAVMTLAQGWHEDYCNHLYRIATTGTLNTQFDQVNATARQRAEAFLKTIEEQSL